MSEHYLRVPPEKANEAGRNGKIPTNKNGLQLLGWGLVSLHSWLKAREIFISEYSFREAFQTIRWARNEMRVEVEAKRSLSWGAGLVKVSNDDDGAFDYVIKRPNGSYGLVVELKYMVGPTHKNEIQKDFWKLTDLSARAADVRYFIYIGDEDNMKKVGWNVKDHNKQLHRQALQFMNEKLIAISETEFYWTKDLVVGQEGCVFARFFDSDGKPLFPADSKHVKGYLMPNTKNEVELVYDGPVKGDDEWAGCFKYTVTPKRSTKSTTLRFTDGTGNVDFSVEVLQKTNVDDDGDGDDCEEDNDSEDASAAPAPRSLSDSTNVNDFFSLEGSGQRFKVGTGKIRARSEKVFDTLDEKPFDLNPPVRVLVWQVNLFHLPDDEKRALKTIKNK